MIKKRHQNPRLVADAAEALRELILACPAESFLGSMNEITEKLGVGIVTVQQATRILEYEGLLTVRRGPGGGYYGTRPDNAALERTFATYMRVHNIGYREAFEMTVSLDCDIAEAAADSEDPALEEKIAGLIAQLERSDSDADCIQFEVDFRDALFQLVNKPLLELMARVAMHLYKDNARPFSDSVGLAEWKLGRRNILNAILLRDRELAWFEAHRYKRMVMRWMSAESDKTGAGII